MIKKLCIFFIAMGIISLQAMEEEAEEAVSPDAWPSAEFYCCPHREDFGLTEFIHGS